MSIDFEKLKAAIHKQLKMNRSLHYKTVDAWNGCKRSIIEFYGEQCWKEVSKFTKREL